VSNSRELFPPRGGRRRTHFPVVQEGLVPVVHDDLGTNVTSRSANSSVSNHSNSNGIGVASCYSDVAPIGGTVYDKVDYDSEYDSSDDEEVFSPPADKFNKDDLRVTLAAIRRANNQLLDRGAFGQVYTTNGEGVTNTNKEEVIIIGIGKCVLEQRDLQKKEV